MQPWQQMQQAQQASQQAQQASHRAAQQAWHQQRHQNPYHYQQQYPSYGYSAQKTGCLRPIGCLLVGVLQLLGLAVMGGSLFLFLNGWGIPALVGATIGLILMVIGSKLYRARVA